MWDRPSHFVVCLGGLHSICHGICCSAKRQTTEGDRLSHSAGVTLMEMLIVVTIVALMIGISFPSVSAGLDGIRLKSAADSTSSFLNAAMNRAERRQQAMQVVLSPKENSIQVYSNEPGFTRKLEMPAGVTIAGEVSREFMLMPGGTVPRITIDLVNQRGAHKLVRLDPITGTPEVLQ